MILFKQQMAVIGKVGTVKCERVGTLLENQRRHVHVMSGG